MRFLRFLSMLSLLLLAGCAGLATDETAEWSVEEFYQAAKEALNSGDYVTAIDYFTKLEARYPYGRYAQQAQLETIYAHHKDSEPAAAVAAADRFIKLHPRHPNVDYAYYMRGLVTKEQGKGALEGLFPSDLTQRDPASLRESFNYFKELVTRFPDSRYTPEAITYMTELRNTLAHHELVVARYNLERGAHLAAVNRAKYVLENYQRSTAIPDALVLMVKAYRLMALPDLAADTLRVLELNHPNHPGLAELKADKALNREPVTQEEE